MDEYLRRIQEFLKEYNEHDAQRYIKTYFAEDLKETQDYEESETSQVVG